MNSPLSLFISFVYVMLYFENMTQNTSYLNIYKKKLIPKIINSFPFCSNLMNFSCLINQTKIEKIEFST